MHPALRAFSAIAALSLVTLSARAAAPGYVDLGKFTPTEGCQFVEVNLHTPLLKFASLFVDHEDREAAALLRGLKHVRVNVVGYNDSTREDVTGRVSRIRQELESQGWNQMVTVQDGGSKSENVVIYVKMHDDDSIDGLLITVVDANKREAVFVNVVGNIKPEQIAALGKGLHIEPLAAIGPKLPAKRT